MIACAGITNSSRPNRDIEEQPPLNSTTVCESRNTCTECISAGPVCSWSLEKQRCNETTATTITSTTTTTAVTTANITNNAITEQRLWTNNETETGDGRLPLTVYDLESCPKFSVDYFKRTNGMNEYHAATVNVSNNPTGEFRALLHRGPVTCQLNRIEFPAVVNDGGERIACQTTVNKTEFYSRASSSSTTVLYFSVVVNGVPLEFDNREDHYVSAHYNGCDAAKQQQQRETKAPAAECVNCSWDDNRYRYYCRWCPQDQVCAGLYQQCDVRELRNTSYPVTVHNVLVRCPSVRIISFEPKYGPSAGGTTVRINVSNHCKTLSENKLPVVTVAGSRCLLPTTSKDGTTITCTITAINSSVLNEGPVEVMYTSQKSASLPGLTVQSDQPFYFVDPEIDNVRPACGPATGGTELTIRGNFLKAGNTLKVYVRENITCAVTEHTQNYVTCTTGGSGQPTTGTVKLEFDNNLSKYASGPPFEYVGVPTVDGGQTFAGIASGGTRILVRGRYFGCIENPLFHVTHNGISYLSSCRVLNDTYMACASPKISRSVPRSTVVTLEHFGFQANFDKNLLSLRPPPGSPGYRLYPDPVFTDFETLNDGRTVIINGLHLNEGYYLPDDLSVRLQRSAVACNVTSVRSRRIVCHTTSLKRGGGDESAATVNGIIVTVGNLVYDVKQKLTFRTGPTRLTWFLIGITVVSLGITCVVAIVYCFKIALMASNQPNEMQSLCEHHRNNNNNNSTVQADSCKEPKLAAKFK